MYEGQVFTGTKDGYGWISVHSRYNALHYFLTAFPEVVLNKVVAITSFDSGPLTPNEREQKMGWRREGDILWTTPIRRLSELPHDQYDEWYVFEEKQAVEHIDVLVSYGDFSLEDPKPTLLANPTWDRNLIEPELRLQEIFWNQICRLRPLSFLAEGDRFNFATRDAAGVQRMVEWFQRRYSPK